MIASAPYSPRNDEEEDTRHIADCSRCFTEALALLIADSTVTSVRTLYTEVEVVQTRQSKS